MDNGGFYPAALYEPQGILAGKDLGKPGWSDADIARQALYYALHGADWAQTRTIAKHPTDPVQPDGTYQWRAENNPILGEHPSTGKVNNYFAATALAHYLLMNALPPEWRKWAQYGTIGLEAGQVRANKMLGIGFTF